MTVLTLEGITQRMRVALQAAVNERKWQDEKYGPVVQLNSEGEQMFDHNRAIQGEGGHELGAWLVIIESELDEAKKALVHGGSKHARGRDSIRAEIVQIAAVAIAALEQHGVEE